MNITEITNLIINTLNKIHEHEDEDKDLEFTKESNLIGQNGVIDSMKLIELCLALEDELLDKGYEFDWQSESAMSKSRSMFLSVESLSNEILSQVRDQK